MAESSRLVDLQAVLVADDIRKENNGKLIIVGAYSTGINIFEMPGSLFLSLLVLFRANRAGEADIGVEVRESWSDRRLGANIHLTIGNVDKLTTDQFIPVTGMPFKVEKTGHLEIYYQYEKEEWEYIRSIPITHDLPPDSVPPS